MLGMLLGIGLNLYLWLFTSIAFTWYVVLGSAATFLVGYSASWLLRHTGTAQSNLRSAGGKS
jgi:hypothetical protein